MELDKIKNANRGKAWWATLLTSLSLMPYAFIGPFIVTLFLIKGYKLQGYLVLACVHFGISIARIFCVNFIFKFVYNVVMAYVLLSHLVFFCLVEIGYMWVAF